MAMEATISGKGDTEVETQAVTALVGTWRRLGPFGPRYEILTIEDAEEATIRVHTSGEITRYAIADLLADPVD